MSTDCDKRETISGYTVEEVTKACEHGWIRSRRLGRGFKVTVKGRVHTQEWIRKDDDLRARVALYVDKEDAGQLSQREKRAAQVEITLNAWRRNEKEYKESLSNLREMGSTQPKRCEGSGSTRTDGNVGEAGRDQYTVSRETGSRMRFVRSKGHRMAARIERWRPKAEQLRASNPDLYQRILSQSKWSEAELISGSRTSFSVPADAPEADPDALVGLFLEEANRVGAIDSRLDPRQIEAVCVKREEDARIAGNIKRHVEELSHRLAALGSDATEADRTRVVEVHAREHISRMYGRKGIVAGCSVCGSAHAPSSGDCVECGSRWSPTPIKLVPSREAHNVTLDHDPPVGKTMDDSIITGDRDFGHGFRDARPRPGDLDAEATPGHLPWTPRTDDVGIRIVDAIGHSLSLDEQWSVRDDRGFTWWGVNAHRKRQRVIVENDSTLVGCQSAWLLSSL